MPISRNQLVKELEPGLNALFGLEYARYENQHDAIYDIETSDRAFEEEVMLSGFGSAQVKPEGTSVNFDDATESFTARYTHETIALAFAITEEAVEDNLYDRISSRYTKALARSMSNTKQVKAANVLNNAFDSSFTGGDGVELCSDAHPTTGGNIKNELSTAADLNETSLEQALIDIAGLTDDRGLKIALNGQKLIIPVNLQFTAERLMKSHPMPVVMVSALTQQGAPDALKALELGAVEVSGKPQTTVREGMEEISISIVDAVKAAAQAKLKKAGLSLIHI